MKARLDALQALLDEAPAGQEDPIEPVIDKNVPQEPTDSPAESVQPIVTPVSPILAERIKPATDLRHAISLNDSFRFTRELFEGNAARMNEVVRRLGEASSLDKAMDLFVSEVHPDEENETAADFVELLKKYFS